MDMAKLECTNCKAIFKDVERVRRCPLCSNIQFVDAEPIIRTISFRRSSYTGTVGFLYNQTMKYGKGSHLRDD